MRRAAAALAAGLAALALSQPAAAHGLSVEARQRGRVGVVEVAYGDQSPAPSAEVTVHLDGAVVAAGHTDEAGAFRFDLPRPGEFWVEVSEPGLHRAVTVLWVQALPPAGAAPAPASAPAARPSPWAGQRGLRLAAGLLAITFLAACLPTRGEASWLGRRDDRARLLALALAAGGASAVHEPTAAVAALAASLGLAVTTGLGVRALARRLWPVGALVAPLVALTPFHRPESAAWALLVPGWSWGPTDAGAWATVVVAGRVLAIALLVVTALEAAPLGRTVRGLQDLRIPQALTQLLLLTSRTLFVLRHDLAETRAALAARGFRPRTDLATCRTVAGVTGGLLVRSVARTEAIEQAMRCRGFEGRLALPPAAPWRGGDTWLVAGAALAGAGLAALGRAWP